LRRGSIPPSLERVQRVHFPHANDQSFNWLFVAKDTVGDQAQSTSRSRVGIKPVGAPGISTRGESQGVSAKAVYWLVEQSFLISANVAAIRIRCSPVSKNSLMLLSSPLLGSKLIIGFEDKLTDYAHDYGNITEYHL